MPKAATQEERASRMAQEAAGSPQEEPLVDSGPDGASGGAAAREEARARPGVGAAAAAAPADGEHSPHTGPKPAPKGFAKKASAPAPPPTLLAPLTPDASAISSAPVAGSRGP